MDSNAEILWHSNWMVIVCMGCMAETGVQVHGVEMYQSSNGIIYRQSTIVFALSATAYLTRETHKIEPI